MKPTHAPRFRSAHGQSGAVTLFAAIVLTVLVTLVTVFSARVLVFEQRASGNQFRATQAFEAAQLGLEQGTAWLQARSVPGTIENWSAANVTQSTPCGENTPPPSGGVYSIYSLEWTALNNQNARFVKPAGQSNCNVGMPDQLTVTMGALTYDVKVDYIQNISALSDLAFLTIEATAAALNDDVGTGRGATARIQQVVSIPGGPAGTGGQGDAPIVVKDCMVGVTGTPDICPANVAPGSGNINQGNVPDCATGSGTTGVGVVSVSGPGTFEEDECIPLGQGANGKHINLHGGTREFLEDPDATVWETLFGDGLSKDMVKALAANGTPGFVYYDSTTLPNKISPMGTAEQPVLIYVDANAGCAKLGPGEFHALVYFETQQPCYLQGGGAADLHGTIAVEGSINKFNANTVVRHSSVTGQLQRDAAEGASVFARVPGTWRDF